MEHPLLPRAQRKVSVTLCLLVFGRSDFLSLNSVFYGPIIFVLKGPSLDDKKAKERMAEFIRLLMDAIEIPKAD